MKRLKCPDCGGQVRLETSPEGHVLGRCIHCAAEFVIEAKGRQHVIVEHRFPDGPAPFPKARSASVSRRIALGLGGVALAGAAASVLGLTRRAGNTPGDPKKGADVLFNVGGEGPGPGQFRDYVFNIGIDSLGRAALIDNDDRIYVFGPEGQFITHYPQGEGYEGKFCALRPGGDLIFAGNRSFHRVSLENGKLLETVKTESETRGWNAAYALTSQGGLAVYSTESHGHGASGPTPVPDQVTFFGADLKEQRQMKGLVAQAIAHDPMVKEWPSVTAIAVDTAGSFYLNIRAQEDNDLRGGIFEFNADGKFQRRIEVEQSWHGRLAIGPNNGLWYGDAWRSDLQHISVHGRKRLELSGLASVPGEALGNLACFAFYPNGDIGVVTMNHRFARLRPAL